MGEANATSDLLSELSLSGAVGEPLPEDRIPVVLTRYLRGITDVKGSRISTTLAKWAEFRRREAHKTWPIGTTGPKDPAPPRSLKSKCPYEVGAAMRGPRSDENVETLHWIFFDVDDLATYDVMLQQLKALGIAYLLTETASHMLHGLPRWHLYLPLEQPLTFPAPGDGHQAAMRNCKAQYMAEYALIAAWLCKLGEIPKNDSSVNDLSQPCYVARRATEDVPPRQVFSAGGRRIRWHQLLLYLGHQPASMLPVPTSASAGRTSEAASGAGAGAAGAGAAGPAGAGAASTSAAAPGKAKKGRKGPTPGETTGSLCRIAAEHLGLLGPQVAPGRFHLRCPWAHEHGAGCQQRDGVLDSSTMLFLAEAEQTAAERTAQGDGVPLDGGVCCKHEHSQGVHRGVPFNAEIFLSYARACGAPLPDRPRYESDSHDPDEDDTDERAEKRRERAQARAAASASALESVHAKLTLTAFAGAEADGLMDTRTWTWRLFGSDGEVTGSLSSGQPFLDPAPGVMTNRAGLDALRGITRPNTLALVSDAADLAVIAALDWPGENKGRIAAFCAPPITLRLLAARIAEWGARVILVGAIAGRTAGREAAVAIADRCELCEINSPARALLAEGGSEHSARAALSGIRIWTRAAHGDFTPIPLTKLYGTGDVANGRRFADSYGHLARYCPETGLWHAWTREAAGGAAWRVDRFRRVEGMAKEVVERIRDIEVERARREGVATDELEKHAKRSLAYASRKTMLSDAASPDNKTGVGLIETIDRLDAQPLLINCMNGTYDIERGVFFAPRQKDLCTKMTAVNYTPDAECPLFQRCLEQWFFDPATGEVNRDMIGYLQAMAGYACSGMLREELIWIHVGSGCNGKALDVATPMLTANRGWTTMGDLIAGDLVFGPDGNPTPILFAHDVQHGRPCFNVATSDGRSIVADADHLWRVRVKGRRAAWQIMTTQQILDHGLITRRRSRRVEYRFSLPAQCALATPPVDLPFDPYTLGVWLGDGTAADSTITIHQRDVEIINNIRSAGIPVRKTKAKYRWALGDGLGRGRRDAATIKAQLRALGVLNNKHVPAAYLTAGTAQRLALLQGLLDTDGHASRGQGQVEFCSTLRPLAEAVLYLARSLGWRATLREGTAKLYGRVIGPRYRVTWTPGPDGATVFRLERKAARIRATLPRTAAAPALVAITPVASRPVRCITVASDDALYLAGSQLLPTHNTTFTKVIQRILGDYAGQVEPEMLMAYGDKTSPGALSTLAQLRGMRLVLASEGESADMLSSSMLKKAASRGKIRAKLMRQDTFEFECSHKLWYDTNHMMTVRERDDGTWRRMRIIRWVNKVADKDIISNLDDRLWAEREGIFQWMLRGAQRWFLHGAISNAHEPLQVKQEVANFRADQDWFAAFLNECCVKDVTATVPTPDLGGVFTMWYKDNHGPKPPMAAFWKALSEKGFENARGTAGGHRIRHGLKLIPQSRAYQKYERAEAASGVPIAARTGQPPEGW